MVYEFVIDLFIPTSMNYRKYGFALVFLVAFVVFAGQSHAYALINLDVGAGANASSSTGSKVEVKSNTSLEAGSSMNSSTSSATTNVRADMSADRVESDGDLQAYAASALRNDESLDDVTFTDDSVTVKYKEKGRFLALVPMTFTVRAVAHADGTLELDYPWYSFLTLDSRDEVETDLRIAVDNAIRAHAVGSVRAEGQAENMTLSASERAEIAAEMHAILKARLAGKSF